MIAHESAKSHTQDSISRRLNENRPKRLAGRPLSRLPAPTPEEIRDCRLRANLSQAQACEIVGISEVMTWSKYETRRTDGEPKGKIDPIRWEFLLLMLGMHPGLIAIPRLGVKQPQATTAQRRRGPSAPSDKNVTFAIEELQHRNWNALEGGRFITLTAACAAVCAMDECLHIHKKRIQKFIDGEPIKAIHHAPRRNPTLYPIKKFSAARYPTPIPVKHRA